MAISVQCESCFQSYRVADDKAGKAIKCKDCGGRIQVPSRGDAGDDEEELPSAPRKPARSARRQSPKKKSSGGGPNRTVLIAGGAGAGVLVIGLVVFLLTRGSGGARQPGAEGPAAVAGAAPVAGTAPDAVAGWKVAADPPAAPVQWPEKLEVSIAIPGEFSMGQGHEVCFASSPSPYVAVGFAGYESEGAQMWNLLTGKQVGTIRGKPSTSNMRIVSPDGKYLAAEVLDSKLPVTVEFWSFETGDLVNKIVCDDAKYSLTIADFTAPDQFFTYTAGPGFGGKYVHRIKIWDIRGGKMIRQIDLESGDVIESHYAFSPGRGYFASIGWESKISIFDLQNGGPATTITLPRKSQRDQRLSGKALTFTPDGRQLIVLLAGPKETRIASIDMQTGKHNPDQDAVFAGGSLSAPEGHASSYTGPKIACLPNQAGYLIDGEVWIDGKTKRIVWRLTTAPDTYNHVRRLPVPNGLVVAEGETGARRLTVLEAPWRPIQASLTAIETKQPARISPGSPVSLDIQIGKIQHGDSDKTKTELTAILKERLAAEGFEVQDEAPIILQVNYEESAGDTLGETKSSSRNPLAAATPTGRSVEATQASVGFSWLRREGNAVIWTGELKFNPQFLILSGEATNENARESMFGRLKDAVFTHPIPYFVPEDDSLLQLPGSSELKS